MVSCPYRTPRDYIEKGIAKYLPKLEKRNEYELPAIGDEVYVFGEKRIIDGFSGFNEGEKSKTLKAILLPYLEERVAYYSSLMGVKKKYQVKVRDMSTRYGVNNRSKGKLTFATLLVYYSKDTIDSVVVHELAHDFVFSHDESFYSYVFRYCPDYKLRHAKLRKHQYHE